jgi:HSP20 family protein
LQEEMMSIVRYRQWPTQSDIRHLLAPLLDMPGDTAAAGTWLPAVDIREHDAQFVLHADLPGVDPASIEVQMDKGVLSIKGERRAPEPLEGQRLSRIERRHGAFERRFALPDSADAEGIVASSRDGVLEIRIPKRAEAAPRRIQVASAGGTA